VTDGFTDSTPDFAVRIDWRRWLMRLLALAGIGVSGYLTWAHLASRSVACGGSQDCDIVQQSVYSEIAGVPIALLGLLAYAALLALTLWRGRAPDAMEEYLPLAIFGISLAGVLYSAYLTYLELFVIYAVCRWCLSSAFIITAIFLLSLPDLKGEAVSSE
jgi:uncharacterized membrane protein